MSAPVRVVLDTNVVLSALVFGGGAAGQMRRAWQQGALLPLASTAAVQELVRVLAYPKFRLTQAEQDELLADYLPYTETVRIPQPPPPVPECRDVLDEPFMHLAVVGKAQVLVSGDRDLPVIAAEFERASGCPISTLDALFRPPLALGLLQNL
ncbi:putative toxin-antitoxin system toxin component, PIN family [Rhodoferax sp.]|uniref:putative toxin-antitoxin system toxin component, PIN family n=1 Tax=Rhodoferax sp. TaxID=50421 RepID=UPI00274C9B5D|nr:putative toxin-antitoxin system toxin component, PIN family [Rhodoferax sp.]